MFLILTLDVSASFARLQAEKLAADHVVQELTSAQSCQDADGLRDYLQNAQLKVEVRLHTSHHPVLLTWTRYRRTKSSA